MHDEESVLVALGPIRTLKLYNTKFQHPLVTGLELHPELFSCGVLKNVAGGKAVAFSAAEVLSNHSESGGFCAGMAGSRTSGCTVCHTEGR